MNPRAGNTCLRSRTRAAIAAMLLALLCFAGIAAAHAEAHEWLHTDQNASGHFCIVTLLQQGHGDAPPPAMPAIAPPLAGSVLIEYTDSQISSQRHDLPEARGPPALP